jgi:hypothetical protein
MQLRVLLAIQNHKPGPQSLAWRLLGLPDTTIKCTFRLSLEKYKTAFRMTFVVVRTQRRNFIDIDK